MALDERLKNELRSYCDALCEDQLDDDQVRRLEEIVLGNPEACSFYIRYMNIQGNFERYEMVLDLPQQSEIQADLFSKHKSQTVASSANTHLQKDSDMSVRQTAALNPKAVESVNARRNYRAMLIFAAACSLLVSLGFSAYWLSQADKGTNNIRSHGEVFEVQNGTDTKELEDGTLLIAHSGAKYSIDGDRKISLITGDLFLIVAKSRNPLIVNTKDGEILATGTRFVVSVAKETRAAVAQGKIMLSSVLGTSELHAGEEGIIEKGKKPTRGPAPRVSHLVSWAKDALRQEELLVEQTEKENGLIAIDPWGQESRLSLRRYDVDVYIEDGIARTTIDQTFFNHNPWNTEGTFYFPLPPDASVSRLAMYVNGTLNEGGMVSRERGQEIYTEILYQRRDPALLEMMEGNMFKMRIFPLEGRQEKRIFLSYTQKLSELYGTQKFWFPMDHENDMAKDLSIRVRVKNGARQFEPTSSTHDLQTSTEGDDLVLEYKTSNIKPDQDLLISLIPNSTDENSRITTFDDGESKFVYANLKPQLKGDVDVRPRQWIVLNDISASRSLLEAKTQQYVLSRLIEEADDDDSVFLVDLNVEARRVSSSFINVRSANAQKLAQRKIETRIGGTNVQAGLQEVAEIIADFGPENPHILYLGDGVATDGERTAALLPEYVPRNATFIGIGIGKGVDGLFLQSAADKTGGIFATINPDEDINWRMFDLIAALNTPRLTDIQILLFDKDDQKIQAEAYSSAKGMTAGESMTVVARCKGELPAQIVFRAKQGAKTIAVGYDMKDAISNADYIPRLWAKRHIDELLKSDMDRKQEIVDFSKKYYVVTPHTSLIVLESDAMYEEYNVERGRKDHWALYPAPKDIDVIKEPIDYSDWYWGYRGKDAQVDAKLQPQSVQEIIDGVQIRINAPFYYWQNSPNTDSRLGLYSLVDEQLISGSESRTKLLTLLLLIAANDKEGIGSFVAAQPPVPERTFGGDQKQTGTRDRLLSRSTKIFMPQLSGLSIVDNRGEEFELLPSLFEDLGPTSRLGQSAVSESLFGTDGYLSSGGIRLRSQVYYESFGNRRRRLSQLMEFHERGSEFNKRLRPAVTLPGDITMDFTSSRFLSNPNLDRSFRLALNAREHRIAGDIQRFNNQFGRWGYRNNWATWNLGTDGRDLDFENIEGMLEELVDEQLPFLELLGERPEIARIARETLIDELDSGLNRFSVVVVDGISPASGFIPLQEQAQGILPIAVLDVFQESIRSQPGATSILAAEYLGRRQELLREKLLDEHGANELKAIEAALKNVESAAAKLENSGRFWVDPWGYRPRPQQVNVPRVQVYNGYNWSFDLTQYATGLYSNTADMVEEVARQYANPNPPGIAAQDAIEQINESRNAFQPVTVSFAKSATKLNVAAGDRYSWTSKSAMSLEEEFVCDGKQIVQFYDELGLAAKREATPERLSAFYQMIPHLLMPAESLTRLFDVELVSSESESFTLKLSLVDSDRFANLVKLETDQDEASEAEKDEIAADAANMYFLLTCDRQGRILGKQLVFEDKTLVRAKIGYVDDKVQLAWFALDVKEGKELELAQAEYTATPSEFSKEMYATERRGFVAIEMPLRKSSYYEKKLAAYNVSSSLELAKAQIESAEQASEVMSLLRQKALSSIQDYNWRRWGGVNSEATAAIDKCIELANKWRLDIKPGDLTLYGSAGAQVNNANFANVAKGHPAAKFFVNRRDWSRFDISQVKENENLTNHIGAYQLAFHTRKNEDVDKFSQLFPHSPLRLALLHNVHQAVQNKVKKWFELNESPMFNGLALTIAGQYFASDDAKQKGLQEEFAEEYWKLQERNEKEDKDTPVTPVIAQILRNHDSDRFEQFIEREYQTIKGYKSITALLHYAEVFSNLSESGRSRELIELAKTRISKRAEEKGLGDSLIGDFAIVHAYWTCGQLDDARKALEVLMDKLDERKIAATANMLALRARLEQQTGNEKAAVDFEERALEIEHKYLPAAINLQAFRQRYSWLWQQYVQAIQEAKQNKDEKQVDEILARAKATMIRWFEIDRENPSILTQMATLQSLADRNKDSWIYLSTVVDLKPRDAETYLTVGSWYQQQDDLVNSEKWIAQAFQWDTANPRWLYEHGRILKQMGRKAEANGVFQKVIEGKWAPGLQQYIQYSQKEISN